MIGYSVWSDTQLDNARIALDEVRRRGLDDTTAQQVLAGMLTECTLWNYANPLYPWTLPLSDGYPPRELSPSTKESCGVFQQRPHLPVWWGPEGLSIADQAIYFMNVRQAVGLFLDRLVHLPRTNCPWNEIQAVQGSEYNGTILPYAENYHSNWDEAGRLLDQLMPEQIKIQQDWMDMATPEEKAEYAKQIADKVVNDTGVKSRLNDQQEWSIASYLGAIEEAVVFTKNELQPAPSQVGGTNPDDRYGVMSFLVSIDRKLSAVLAHLGIEG